MKIEEINQPNSLKKMFLFYFVFINIIDIKKLINNDKMIIIIQQRKSNKKLSFSKKKV